MVKTLPLLLAVLACLSWTSRPQGTSLQQVRPGQVAPGPVKAPGATGVLRGRIIAGDTGAGLRRARVTLNAPALREARVTTTDLEGRWEFKDLRAARYTIAADKPPYVPLQFGQRIPSEPGKPVDLKDGQTIEDLDIRLPRGSVITGRVVDDVGDPAAFVTLQAFRMQYVNGRRQMVPAGAPMRTDDLGQYRLYGLPPGIYYVGSFATLWGSQSIEDVGVSFGATYFPGTLNTGQAQPVTVRLGQERNGVDFSLLAVKLARLSGVVLDSGGRPAPGVEVIVMQQRLGLNSVTTTSQAGATTGTDGQFTIPNVAPGQYSLASIGASSNLVTAGERGSMDVVVNGADIEGLVIALTKGSRVTGQVEFEGENRPEPSPSIRLYTSEPGGGGPISSPGTSTINADWSFEITGVSPGERVFRMVGLPSRYMLKAVLVRGADVIDIATKFNGKEDFTDVHLVVTGRAPLLSGAVVDDKGHPVHEYSVVAFARDSARWTTGTRYIATARSDQNGQFTMTVLPPGEYLVAALEYLEGGDSSDPEFLASIRLRATPVALAEGVQKTLELKVLQDEKK